MNKIGISTQIEIIKITTETMELRNTKCFENLLLGFNSILKQNNESTNLKAII